MIQKTKRFKTGRSDNLHSVSQNLRFSNPKSMKWHDDDVIIFSQPVYKTCQRQPTALKLGRLIVYSKFHKICKFENHVTRNDVITKNSGNMQTSVEPNKIHIIQKDLMRDIQKCNFYWIWAIVSKVMGIYVKFYHGQSPNMVMSCDPGSKCRFFLPDSILNFSKSY